MTISEQWSQCRYELGGRGVFWHVRTRTRRIRLSAVNVTIAKRQHYNVHGW